MARVTPDGVTTLYVGELYEVRRGSPDAVTRYYYLGGQRVAMRQPDDAVVWLHGDHLGSTSLTTGDSGNVWARQAYYPFGATRWVTGTLPTDFGFTGQRNDGYIKLVQMGVRWYDPQVGRWISPDTIVPDPANPQSLNRYAYVYNNPMRHVDLSGYGIKEDLEKFVKKAGKALAQGWTNVTTSVEALKGIANYGPYVVFPDDFCLGSLGCWGGIEYARSMYAESTYGRRDYQQKFAGQVMNIYLDEEGRLTDSVSALTAISDYVAYSTKSTDEYVNDMSLLILGFDHSAGGFLPMFDREAGLPFNSAGFGSYFGDPSITNNQVNHFWFFVHAGYQFGRTEESEDMLNWFALLHETDIPLVGGEGSVQDYRLSLFGIQLGIALRLGDIQPGQIGGLLDFALGVSDE